MLNLAELQENFDKSMQLKTIIQSSQLQRKEVEKNSKHVEYSNSTKLDVKDIYRTKYPRIREYTFFSTNGVLTKCNHILSQSFSKY